ncbi:MAG: HAMP domain-containing sensor histidine kinase, partial [Elusimicrobiota bacterium]
MKPRPLELFTQLPDIDYVVIRDSTGKPVFEFAPHLRRLRKAESSSRLPVFLEIVEGERTLGTVRLAMSLEHAHAQLQTIFLRGIAVGLLMLLSLAVVSWWLGQLIGAQLERFGRAIGARDPAAVKDVPGILRESELEGVWSAFVTLLTDLGREEQQRREVEKVKNDLTHMVVHDLKHPLTVLQTVLALIKDKREGAAPAPEFEPLAMADRAVRRLNAMIEDVLQIARMDNTDVPLERRRFPLGEFIGEVADENRIIVEHSGRVFRLEAAQEGLDRVVFGDKALLRRLIGNLVLNAVEHSGEGAGVTLGARLGARGGSAVEIFVHNEGSAIPKTQIAAIFNKYASFADSVRNVGLGL